VSRNSPFARAWGGLCPHARALLAALPAVASALLVGALALSTWRAAAFASAPATPILEDRSGNFLSEGEREYRRLGFWDVEGPMNPRVALCLVEIEDRRFYSHGGIDLRALGRSLVNNLRGMPRQGGSTIAMQVAAMQRPAPRTALNKLREACVAYAMVSRHGREGVLRQYLKIVPQGNQIFGVAYSARRYFRKPLADLGLAESALLASLPKSPGKMNLFTSAGYAAARSRAELVLATLGSRGLITDEERLTATERLATIGPLPRESRPSWAYHYILRVLDDEAARRGSYSRPLATSLDPGIQAIASRAADRALAENGPRGAMNVAVVIADRRSGQVLGYVGSASFFDAEGSGSINYARAPRSSGSALKPILFARGLDSGAFTPASVLADLPFAVLSPGGEYRALNFDDDYLGPMLYRRALANSRNVPAIRVLEGVGVGEFLVLARSMGLARSSEGADHYGYGLAIGGLYVTLEDLVAAYGCLANDGRAFSLRWERDASPDSRGERFLSAYAARTIASYLSDPSARYPSFPRMGSMEFPFPVAIKTGTSQGFRDAWTLAFSDSYLIGIWIGRPDNGPMNHVAGLVTARYAAEAIAELHPRQTEGIDVVPFPLPEGEAAEVCPISGELAGPDCPSSQREIFPRGRSPLGACAVHRRYAVDIADGALAGAGTPPSRVALRPFVVLPPEYALWGAKRGLAPPPERAEGAARPAIKIAYPSDGARYRFDPGTPARFQSIPLQALVSPRTAELLWWSDGSLVAKASYPYGSRLPLAPGRHVLAVGLPGDKPGDEGVERIAILVE
jgi:penicillin-binding protein 1C